MSVIGDALTVPAGAVILNPSISRTSGPSSVSSVYAVRYGNVICLIIRFVSGNSAVSTGSNSFVGEISGIPLPASTVVGAGYMGSTAFMGGLGEDGAITIRVLAANKSASTTSTYGISWTYIAEDI